MAALYQLLTGRGGTDNVDTAIDLNPDGIETDRLMQIEERRRYVRHVRIERNSRAAALARKIHGFICQCCGFDFAKVYGNLGTRFIEIHHLIPLYSLSEGQSVAMNPKDDFAALCANCHRMIHRDSPCIPVDDLAALPGVMTIRELLIKSQTAG